MALTVRFKPTGEIGTIPDNEFDPSIYEPLDQGGNQGFLMNVLSDLSRPFTSTVSKGASAIETLGLLTTSPEFRKQVSGKQLSPEEAKKLGSYVPLTSELKQSKTRGQLAKESAQDVAGIAAWAVPFGKGASLASRALLPGAASGGLLSASDRDATLSSILGGAATGAVTAGVLDKLLGVGKAAQKAGGGMRKNVVKPKVPATPYAASQEKAIAEGLQKAGLKGSAAAQKSQMPGVMEKLSSQIDDVLKKSAATEKSTVIKKAINNHLDDSLQFVKGDPLYEKAKTRLLLRLPKDKITVRELFDFKKYLNSQLKQAFRKSSGELKSPLTPGEEVGMVILDKVDDVITKMEPGVKELTLQQSALFKGAPGIMKQAEQVYRIPFLNVPVSTRPVQAAADATGSALQGAGGGLDRILSAGSDIPPQAAIVGAQNLFGGGASQQVPQQPVGVQQQAAPQREENEEWVFDEQVGTYISRDGQWAWDGSNWVPNEQAQQGQQGAPSREEFEQALLDDLATGGKNITKIKTVMDTLYPKTSTMTAAERGQMNTAQGALGLVDIIEQNYALVQEQGLTAQTGGLGRLGGVRGSVASIAQSSPEAASYEATKDAFLSNLARASGEKGVLTDYDIARIRKAIPTFYDTPETAKRNLDTIRQIISAAIARKMSDKQLSDEQEVIQ